MCQLRRDVALSDKTQKRVAEWVRSRLGEKAMRGHERALRLVEEAIELGQQYGLALTEVLRLAAMVYEKPPGSAVQELGGVGVCLLACAEAVGLPLSMAIANELDRIEALPAERFRERQAWNVRMGVGEPAEAGDAGESAAL